MLFKPFQLVDTHGVPNEGFVIDMSKTESADTVKEITMKIAEWLIKKGKIEGKLEGIVQEKILIATRLLEKDSSQQFVAEITGLSLDEIQILTSETIEKQ